jgi:3-oxoacyl-[acyl-carrier-protein] synthase II
MSEGAGCLILEDLDHVIKRGAESSIYAEILGVGSTADANHITNPNSDGDGAYRCMADALKNSNIEPNSVNFINAHATSTPTGDLAEIKAIKKLFGQNSNKIYISSFKGSLGHLLGAAGAAEIILTILSLKNRMIAPSANLDEIDPAFELTPNLEIVSKDKVILGQSSRIIALKNSFGFGGTNASICIGNYKY